MSVGPSGLAVLAETLRAARGLAHKRDIDAVLGRLKVNGVVPVGDDCAAIPDGDGWLLFAAEGFVADFVRGEPWFAGYCGVMVNLSDVAAMGGRPIAVVDVVWSQDHATSAPILDGLAAAAAAYAVPIVGGHTNTRSDGAQLAVAVLGRARSLLTSFDALAAETLVAAIDLRGRYHEPHPYWDASTGSPPERLRRDLDLLPQLAEAGWCRAAKDISMAGLVGTVLMLLEGSGLGGVIDVTAVPRPDGVPLDRWLQTFPSYGFVVSVPQGHVGHVLDHFREVGIAAAPIGRTDTSRILRLSDGAVEVPFWDLAQTPLTGCTTATRETA